MAIGNPVEWGSNNLGHAASAVRSAIQSIHRPEEALEAPLPVVRRIEVSDLKNALQEGLQDFIAYRTDVLFLVVVYPIIGLVLARIVIGQGLFQLLFPLTSGFALIGPFVGLGLYEMSRRREQGRAVGWATAFQVLRSPSAGAIALLGLLLTAIFIAWLFVAQGIFDATIGGPHQPESLIAFAQEVFTTTAGWMLIVAGVSIGFLFALAVFVVSAVSFPLLLDRQDVGLDVAISTSVRAIAANPRTMAIWAMIIAGAMILGSIPALIGLIVVIPILGHATWHVYRRLIGR
jgi:uncharacterized membrane protein